MRARLVLVWMMLFGCGREPPPAAPPVVVVAPPDAAPATAPRAERPPEPARPALALGLVVDRSGSMSGDKIELARAACLAALDELDESDWLLVLSFDSLPHTVVAPRRATDREAIEGALAGIEAAGGTEIFPALELALRELEGLVPERKHVLLLTDGMAPASGMDELVGDMRARGVTLSTVALGDGADHELMKRIAELGGGRFFAVEDPRELAEIFRAEAKRARTP